MDANARSRWPCDQQGDQRQGLRRPEQRRKDASRSTGGSSRSRASSTTGIRRRLYYDVNNGAFDDSEEIFMPFSLAAPLEARLGGQHQLLEAGDGRLLRGIPELRVRVDPVLGAARQRGAAGTLSRLPRQLRRRAEAARALRAAAEQPGSPRSATGSRSSNAAGDDSPVLVGLSFMFLFVCVLNTVGLLLAKFIGKAPQIGLRRALGATRSAIFGQHLMEVGVVGRRWRRARSHHSPGSACAACRPCSRRPTAYAHLDFNMLGSGPRDRAALELRRPGSIRPGACAACRPRPFLKTQ